MPTFGDRRIMGCSRSDLERWVAELMPGLAPSFDGNTLAVPLDGFAVTVSVRDAPPRSLGLIRFRELEVRFDYPQERADEARAWIARFDRHTQRGGG